MNPVPYALLAEDDAGTVDMFFAVLTGHNPALRIVQVANGEEALDFLMARGRFDGRDSHNPAVVFAGIDLPGMDGLELLREIRAYIEFRTIPVVMLAGSLNSEKLERSYELGANAHAVKPVDYTQFPYFVRTLCDFWLTLNAAPAGYGRHVKP